MLDYTSWRCGSFLDPSGGCAASGAEDRKSGLIVAGALLMDVLFCNVLLKPIVARTRPFDVNTAIQLLVNRPVDYSFPSGHTAASFASVAGLFMAGEKRLWKPALVLAVLIAFSRLYLYVHYPTDVLGGLLLGLLSGYIGSRLVLWLMDRKKAANGLPDETILNIDRAAAFVCLPSVLQETEDHRDAAALFLYGSGWI